MACCHIAHRVWYENPFFYSASAINVRVTHPGIKERQSDSFTMLHMYIGNWHIHPDPQRPATNPFIPPPAGPCLSPGTHHPEEHSGASRWSSLRQRLKSGAHRTQLLQSGLSRYVTQYQQMTSFSLSQLKSKLTRCLQTHRVDGAACNACEAAPMVSTPKLLISLPRWGRWLCNRVWFSWISWILQQIRLISRRNGYISVPTVPTLQHGVFYWVNKLYKGAGDVCMCEAHGEVSLLQQCLSLQ